MAGLGSVFSPHLSDPFVKSPSSNPLVSEMKESHQDPITSHPTCKPYFSESAGQEKEKKKKIQQVMNSILIMALMVS